MRAYLPLFTLLFLSFTGIGQNVVPKVPVYEIFSSSTCPPCKPANDHMSPILEPFKDQIVVVKYQMSWPGSGDPYYTAEGQSRRGFYSVNSVPAVFRNSAETPYSNITESAIESDLNHGTNMKMELRYMIDSANQTVRMRARIEALADYTDGAHRIYLPIIEHLTDNNKKSNGETEFHNVFKKMMPSSLGDIIIGEVDSGTVIEYDTAYQFQGDYRLPANALDPIDHETEHSVEEFTDLHVVMFMQSLVDKSIYQGAVGEKVESEENLEREWGTDPLPPLSIAEFNAKQKMSAYPNPTSDQLNVVYFKDRSDVQPVLRDLSGQIVATPAPSVSSGRWVFETRGLAAGVYVVQLEVEGELLTKRVAVFH